MVKVEISDLKTVNQTLKQKLEEAQESLKSNENLITYLNKQLNEKGQGAPMSSRPPTVTGFKPSMDSVQKLTSNMSTIATNSSLPVRRDSFSRQSFDKQASPRCPSPATNPTIDKEKSQVPVTSFAQRTLPQT